MTSSWLRRLTSNWAKFPLNPVGTESLQQASDLGAGLLRICRSSLFRELHPGPGRLPGVPEAAGEAPGRRQPPAGRDPLPAGTDPRLEPPARSGRGRAQPLHLGDKEQAR